MLETLWPPSTLQIRAGGLRIVAITDEHLPHVCTITFADIYGDTIPDHAFTWLFTSTPVAAAQFRWSNRANMSSKEWSLDLAAFNEHTGEFIGAIDLRSTNFATTRCISTGSWVLHKHQGRGYGTTIRRAICEYGLVTLVESVTAPAGPNGTPLPAVLAELRRDDYTPNPDVVITGHTPSLHEFLTGERPGPAPSE